MQKKEKIMQIKKIINMINYVKNCVNKLFLYVFNVVSFIVIKN